MSKTYNNVHWRRIAAGLEPNAANPLDLRIVVDTYASLYNPSTFEVDNINTAYLGMVVTVVHDSVNLNGVYYLSSFPSTTASNWVKISGGTGNAAFVGITGTTIPSSQAAYNYYLYINERAITPSAQRVLYMWSNNAWSVVSGLTDGDMFVDITDESLYVYAQQIWTTSSAFIHWNTYTIIN